MRNLMAIAVFATVLGASLLFGAVQVLGQGTLAITVSINSKTYTTSSQITLTGQVTQAGTAVPNAVVVFELRDSKNNLKASGFVTTNSTGMYSRTLTVSPDFSLGSYTVLVNVSANGQTASNTASFQVIPEFLSGLSLLLWIAIILFAVLVRMSGFRGLKSSIMRN